MKSFSFMGLSPFLLKEDFFALTIALTLTTDVITEHGSEDEIFLGRKFIQGTSDDEADGLQTFWSSEIDIQVLTTRRLQHIGDALTL